MSAAAAEPVEDGEAPAAPSRGKKKLIILVVAALLAASGMGGAVWFVVKKRQAVAAAAAAAAAAAEGAEDGEPVAEVRRPAPREVRKNPPTFLPLDNFVVNLADRDSERFAQIGITLELDDPKVSDQLKVYMPAIRNGILMVLAQKTSKELFGRAGKEKLAAEIMRESVRPLGITLENDAEEKPAPGQDDEDGPAKTPLEESPVRHVHFSSFIIQ